MDFANANGFVACERGSVGVCGLSAPAIPLFSAQIRDPSSTKMPPAIPMNALDCGFR
jgi:hypothetical protein